MHEHTEPDRFLGQSLADLVEQEVRGLRRRVFVREVRGPGLRSDAKPPVTAPTVSVGEGERRDSEERLPRETRGDRLGRVDKPLRVRVGAEERAERLGSARPEGGRGAEKRQELPPVRTGKPLVEWATISVWTCSARWKRMAIPLGPDCAGSLSGMVGRPVAFE